MIYPVEQHFIIYILLCCYILNSFSLTFRFYLSQTYAYACSSVFRLLFFKYTIIEIATLDSDREWAAINLFFTWGGEIFKSVLLLWRIVFLAFFFKLSLLPPEQLPDSAQFVVTVYQLLLLQWYVFTSRRNNLLSAVGFSQNSQTYNGLYLILHLHGNVTEMVTIGNSPIV